MMSFSLQYPYNKEKADLKLIFLDCFFYVNQIMIIEADDDFSLILFLFAPPPKGQ
ncbi:hypothetical protein F4694_001294 [Bacillus niacini]|uniref:Uncharacterized protein n=1 Tax=Neobacillus niacini TaxID=86668 RepID=A0A852T9L9_9BACI|nr:hypothetical protein [Neobacillus niacini]